MVQNLKQNRKSRIFPDDLLEGGHSICRNVILQKMFIVIGRGEHMGSGADIINKGREVNDLPDG